MLFIYSESGNKAGHSDTDNNILSEEAVLQLFNSDTEDEDLKASMLILILSLRE